MRKYSLGLCLTALALALTAIPSSAQSTIPVPLDNLLRAEGLGPPGGFPGLEARPESPTGWAVIDFQPASWVEYRVTTTTPGLYSINMVIAQSQDPVSVMSFETRPASADTDRTATRYASPDTMNYGTPSSDYWVFVDIGAVQDAGGSVITVPLWEGENILRVQNISGRHNAAFTYPPDLSDPNNRPWEPFWSNLRLGGITLNRVGDLPAFGTITGTVTGDKPAGVRAPNALVFSNPPGRSPAEPSIFWKSGYYTYTGSDGTYSLMSPSGSRDVKAGRPDSYQVQGSPVVNVNVPASGTATANLSLTSIFHDVGGMQTAYVQDEYFLEKTGRIALLNVDGENGYKMGWIDVGDSLTFTVDAPQSGLYKVTTSYFNGGATGTVRLSTDLGSTIEGTQPGLADQWGTRQTTEYATPIYLVQGPNVITKTHVSGASDMDATHFQLLPDTPTVGQVTGIVTNSLTGSPVQGATVTLGNNIVTTNAEGRYSIISNAGTGLNLRVTHPYADAPASASVDVTAGGTTTRDFQLTVRPHINLNTAAGANWLVNLNTGGTADFSAVGASEAGFQAINVPADWATMEPDHEVYGWYRLHFNVPEDFKTLLPNRKGVFRVTVDPASGERGIHDVDAVYLNGTLIGTSGAFPDPPLAVQPDGHVLTEPFEYAPGLQVSQRNPRAYYFPLSLLNDGENVLAIKVFNHTGSGGIRGQVELAVAMPTASVSGQVVANGSGVPNVRVSAMNADGISSDWAMTDASGNFTLSHVGTGFPTIGAARPGYLAVTASPGSVSENAQITGFVLNTSVVPDGPAPTYDDFTGTGTDWQAKWWAQSLVDPNDAPFITQPGFDVHSFAEIPSSITIEGGFSPRGALLSKDRFSQFASVNSAKLVSALSSEPVGTGTQPNALLYLSGQMTEDIANWSFTSQIELDIEGYALRNGEQHPRYMIWADQVGDLMSTGPVPTTHMALGDVTPENPMILTITRTGSYYDFYINGVHIYDANLPKQNMGNHRLGLYSYPTASAVTWDWVKAAPTVGAPIPGDLSGNGMVDAADAAIALQIWAGLDEATPQEVATGDVVAGNGINMLDAVKLMQTANG